MYKDIIEKVDLHQIKVYNGIELIFFVAKKYFSFAI